MPVTTLLQSSKEYIKHGWCMVWSECGTLGVWYSRSRVQLMHGMVVKRYGAVGVRYGWHAVQSNFSTVDAWYSCWMVWWTYVSVSAWHGWCTIHSLCSTASMWYGQNTVHISVDKSFLTFLTKCLFTANNINICTYMSIHLAADPQIKWSSKQKI